MNEREAVAQQLATRLRQAEPAQANPELHHAAVTLLCEAYNGALLTVPAVQDAVTFDDAGHVTVNWAAIEQLAEQLRTSSHPAMPDEVRDRLLPLYQAGLPLSGYITLHAAAAIGSGLTRPGEAGPLIAAYIAVSTCIDRPPPGGGGTDHQPTNRR